MNDKIIRGAGGAPPTPPSPTKAPDTLNSRQFASIQDLISEGEIEGSATASKAGLTKGTAAYNNAFLKDIFLNDTPILGANANVNNPQEADFNYQNISFIPRFGTSNQQHVAGLGTPQATIGVGGKPQNPAGTVASGEANAITTTIAASSTNPDAVKVTVTFPQLQKATDKGDLLGSSVQLKIQVNYNSGGYQNVITDTITGRTADAYQKEYRVTLTGSFPVDIRLVRLTRDAQDTNLVDEFAFTSITKIFDRKENYPNIAYTHLRIDSEQFSSIPKSCLLYTSPSPRDS